jgi:hypothetical protein
MLRRTAAVAGFLTVLGGRAEAQRVTGVVVEDGRPVNAVFVTLMRPDSVRIAAFVSDSSGRFFFDLPAPGRYLLRAERIGHATSYLEVDVPASGLAVRMVAPAAAIALNAIAVRGDGRCTVRPTAAAAAARIWDEARKSLELTRFAAAREELTFRGSRYVRELDASGERVLSERFQPLVTAGTRAFRPVDLAILDTVGFVTVYADTLEYFALDAEILLSDQFLDHHCFEAVAGGPADPDRVGLRFRPVPARRLPEIEGTLWLDARTSALLHIDFRYVQATRLVPIGNAIGRVEFARTDGGLVYVDRWWLRMPRIVEQQGRRRITGWVEEGGVVQGIGSAND